MSHITAVAKMPRLCVESTLTLIYRGHYYSIVRLMLLSTTADARPMDGCLTKLAESGTLVFVVSLSNKGSY